MTWLWLNSTKF